MVVSNTLNNKLSTKINAIFLATILVTGIIAFASTSFKDVQAFSDYGMTNNYKKPFGKDANIKYIKCNNINANINDLSVEVGSQNNDPITGTYNTGASVAANDEQVLANHFGNGETNNKRYIQTDNDFTFACINNNNNDNAGTSGDGTDGNGNVGGGGTNLPDIGVTPLAFTSLGYENGDVSTGWEWGVSQAEDVSPPSNNLRTIDKSSTTLPPSPDPDGSQLLEVIVNPDDTPIDSRSGNPVDGSPRAELLHNQPFQIGTQNPTYIPGDNMWYHWYTLFPNSLTIPKDRFHIWTQFHQIPAYATCYNNGVLENDCAAIPLGFNLRDSTRDIPGPPGSNRDTQGPELQLNIIELNRQISNFDNFLTLWEEEVELGGWYEFLLHVNWQKCNVLNAQRLCDDHGDALVELWIKRPGENLLDPVVTRNTQFATHYNMDEDGTAYAKQGLYTNSGVSQTIYHDGMEIAKCPSSHQYYHPNTQQCFSTPPYS